MVNMSELPFRMVTRQYGCDIAVTPMISAKRFVELPSYREAVFSTCGQDRPLIAQFCGDDPETLLKAAQLLQHQVDAVDLNLGCPQGIARKGHYGAFLLEERALLRRIVETMSRGLDVPVTCKIRLLPTMESTIETARTLARAGCKLLTIHGRTKEEKKQKVGPCRWHEIRQVIEALRSEFPSFPVVANGGIECFADVQRCLDATGADGVMSSEALLENPALFSDNLRVTTRSEEAARTLRRRQRMESAVAEGATASQRVCSNCGKRGMMSRHCPKCDEHWYCKKKCMNVHWKKGHSQSCKRNVTKRMNRAARSADFAQRKRGFADTHEGAAADAGAAKRARLEEFLAPREAAAAPGAAAAAEERLTVRVSQLDLAMDYLEAAELFCGSSPQMLKSHLFCFLMNGSKMYADIQRRLACLSNMREAWAIVHELQQRWQGTEEPFRSNVWYLRHRRHGEAPPPEEAKALQPEGAAPAPPLDSGEAAPEAAEAAEEGAGPAAAPDAAEGQGTGADGAPAGGPPPAARERRSCAVS